MEYDRDAKSYRFLSAQVELSGTPSFLKRAAQSDRLGSFRGKLILADGTVWEDSVGTGVNYRELVRELTFRFPIPSGEAQFHFYAEHPETGVEESVLVKNLSVADYSEIPQLPEVEVREIGAPATADRLWFNFYADGYSADRKEAFFKAAKRAVDALQTLPLPEFERLAFRAVFSPSALKLGKAKDLGFPIPERDSFLGLYFPYWNAFGRWYNVVYPTRETRFRNRLATVPYDYALAILDDREYWGVGNYRELTAIPAENERFTYLLVHELGHFFGLNEEYEGGGRTELEFAPGIEEPWSQNITFLSRPEELKWKAHVPDSTPIPTPKSVWSGKGPIGAYLGGYADSPPLKHSHKPGLRCVMESGKQFCSVCQSAISERVLFDLGAAL